jgi:oligoribonuclease (3'-5' exoribonuclease)
MATCYDVMVDIETTGTSPDHSAIIQLAAVKFDLVTRDVDQNFFNRALKIPPKRFWDEDTRNWWGEQKPSVFQDIARRMENPAVVLKDFVEWCQPANNLRFWAKPTHFDYSFVQSYLKQFGLMNPFHYRNAIDLNSFLRGITRSTDLPFVQTGPMAGDAHNALFDVLHQIATLFDALDGKYLGGPNEIRADHSSTVVVPDPLVIEGTAVSVAVGEPGQHDADRSSDGAVPWQ